MGVQFGPGGEFGEFETFVGESEPEVCCYFAAAAAAAAGVQGKECYRPTRGATVTFE